MRNPLSYITLRPIFKKKQSPRGLWQMLPSTTYQQWIKGNPHWFNQHAFPVKPNPNPFGKDMGGCAYCEGARCPCTCVSDCGARGEYSAHICSRAPLEIRRQWWLSHGYTEKDLEGMK